MKILTNLIIIFDPCVSKLNLNNWIVIFWPIIILTRKQWIGVNLKIILKKNFFNIIKDNFKPIIFKIEFFSNILISILIIIIIINLYGLIPYVFSLTANQRFNLILTFCLIILIFIRIIKRNKENRIIHLVPKSSPIVLIIPLVIIEFIRTLIKPLTLGVRITANIIAGHLIISLVRGIIINLTFLVPGLFIIIALNILETIVAMIQSYVLIILTAIYIQDTVVNNDRIYFDSYNFPNN